MTRQPTLDRVPILIAAMVCGAALATGVSLVVGVMQPRKACDVGGQWRDLHGVAMQAGLALGDGDVVAENRR